MILLYDVETSALADFNKCARDPSQPHIVQLAAALMDDAGNILETYKAIAKPDGWIISEEVTKIHGITHAHAMEVGIDEKIIVMKLLEWIKKATCIVAFNVSFDKFLARIGLRRFDLMTDADDAWWKALPTFCAMRPMTDFCQLPFADGKKHYAKWWKFPTLQEAHKHIFGVEFDKAHSANADLEATAKVYLWLCKQLNFPIGMPMKF